MPRGRKIVKQIEIEERTIREAAEEFYKHNMVKGLAQETQRSYRGYVEGLANWCGEATLISDITPKVLEDYIYKKHQDGNKPVTVATVMTHIRTFLNFCMKREYMEKFDVMIPKYERELKDPYTDEEMERLLKKPVTKNWVEYRNWVMVNYFFSTGQRLSTVLNIKVEHLNLDNAKVKLVWNKDKRQKYVPLSTAIIRILREYIDVSDLQEQDYLFPEYEGKQLQRRSAQDAIADYNHSRGVERTGIHLFRHTFAKNYIVNGGNPMMLQKLLNHKTIDQTMKYVNLYGTDVADGYDLINPLDTFKRKNHTAVKRTTVREI